MNKKYYYVIVGSQPNGDDIFYQKFSSLSKVKTFMDSRAKDYFYIGHLIEIYRYTKNNCTEVYCENWGIIEKNLKQIGVDKTPIVCYNKSMKER